MEFYFIVLICLGIAAICWKINILEKRIIKLEPLLKLAKKYEIEEIKKKLILLKEIDEILEKQKQGEQSS